MGARDRAYFASLVRDEGMLRSHGFDSWPDARDLARFACDLEDGLQTLAGTLGVRLAKGVRGNWVVIAKDEEAV